MAKPGPGVRLADPPAGPCGPADCTSTTRAASVITSITADPLPMISTVLIWVMTSITSVIIDPADDDQPTGQACPLCRPYAPLDLIAAGRRQSAALCDGDRDRDAASLCVHGDAVRAVFAQDFR